MSEDTFPLAAYLARTGLEALPPATPEGLALLVAAQTRAVAFENLDPLAGRPVAVSREAVLAKILDRGRGGYCFELNGLLGCALEAAEFRFTTRLARVNYRRTEPGPLSHQVFLVDCGGTRWLADAGFGGPGLVGPVPFAPGTEFAQGAARFRLGAAPGGDVQLRRLIDGVWSDLYLVAGHAILPVDIEVANHFVSTWERSPFRAMFMVARPVDLGFAMIQGTDLVHLDGGFMPVERRPLADAADLRSVLAEVFGVKIDAEVAAAAWLRVNREAGAAA